MLLWVLTCRSVQCLGIAVEKVCHEQPIASHVLTHASHVYDDKLTWFTHHGRHRFDLNGARVPPGMF